MALEHRKKTVVVAQNGTYSAGFSIISWAIFFMALFPDMDAGAIGIEFSIDAGVTYNPIVSPVAGIDAVLVASGSDPGWVDFSDWVRAFPADSAYLMRFTCASQTTKAVTITVLMRG